MREFFQTKNLRWTLMAAALLTFLLMLNGCDCRSSNSVSGVADGGVAWVVSAKSIQASLPDTVIHRKDLADVLLHENPVVVLGARTCKLDDDIGFPRAETFGAESSRGNPVRRVVQDDLLVVTCWVNLQGSAGPGLAGPLKGRGDGIVNRYGAGIDGWTAADHVVVGKT